MVGEADSGGRGAVQRRDPTSGALLTSHPVTGATAPAIAGPVDSAVWVSQATGMMGYVERLDAATLTSSRTACREGTSTNTCVEETNDITARLANGLLWVTQMAGGGARNYCAKPSNGHVLAPITLPEPTEDEVLAIAPHQIFYAAPSHTARQFVREEAVPVACQAR